jgi:hypothetical protein
LLRCSPLAIFLILYLMDPRGRPRGS